MARSARITDAPMCERAVECLRTWRVGGERNSALEGCVSLGGYAGTLSVRTSAVPVSRRAPGSVADAISDTTPLSDRNSSSPSGDRSNDPFGRIRSVAPTCSQWGKMTRICRARATLICAFPHMHGTACSTCTELRNSSAGRPRSEDQSSNQGDREHPVHLRRAHHQGRVRGRDQERNQERDQRDQDRDRLEPDDGHVRQRALRRAAAVEAGATVDEARARARLAARSATAVSA